jgi:hypothetical protein
VEEPPLATEPEADNHTDIPPPDWDKSGVHEQPETPTPEEPVPHVEA